MNWLERKMTKRKLKRFECKCKKTRKDCEKRSKSNVKKKISFQYSLIISQKIGERKQMNKIQSEIP